MRRAHLVPIALAALAGAASVAQGFAFPVLLLALAGALALRSVAPGVRASVLAALALAIVDARLRLAPPLPAPDRHMQTLRAVVLAERPLDGSADELSLQL
ncbi:MAG: hypothetical protein ACREM2_07595, partial [Vulcanimicrobiaceae bacterium]